MKTRLAVVSLLHPVQFSRAEMSMSTLIDNEEWRIVSTFTGGRDSDANIGDIEVYKNVNAGKSDMAPVWKYYGSVPAAGVRGYRKLVDVEPEAEPGEAAPKRKQQPAAAG